MSRLALMAMTAALGLTVAGCTIDGPPPGRSDPIAEMERQERIRQEVERRERLCQMMDRDSDRYERDCEQGRDD